MTRVPLCNDSNVQLRFLVPEDLPEIKKLCREWFPIEYPHSWYEDISCNRKFFSLAAVYKFQIIGLIVVEIKSQSKCNKEDQGLLSPHFPKTSLVAYILTLGVVQEFRRNGIATLLLDSVISHLTNSSETSDCKAIYLHVLTTNTTAIQFYEQRKFKVHSFLPLYYNVHGVAKDGYSYVLYVNGGHPPWTVLDYLKHWVRAISRIELCSLPKHLMTAIGTVIANILPTGLRSNLSVS
ncbi:N-alpha-acetyltransferase 60 [Tachypleus tridentatus]|uniref:N-alpha-acetyltransferase 60 n=1 Tax=Tachypleus tridentatus TaxID=6853 RepID=UPI003FCFB9BE